MSQASCWRWGKQHHDCTSPGPLAKSVREKPSSKSNVFTRNSINCPWESCFWISLTKTFLFDKGLILTSLVVNSSETWNQNKPMGLEKRAGLIGVAYLIVLCPQYPQNGEISNPIIHKMNDEITHIVPAWIIRFIVLINLLLTVFFSVWIRWTQKLAGAL